MSDVKEEIKIANISDFKGLDILSLDFETVSLVDKTITLFSVAGIKKLKFFDHSKLISGAYEAKDFNAFWNDNSDKTFIFHNAKFDLQVIKNAGFKIDDVIFEDTMVMSHLINENKRKSLKDLRVSVLGKPPRASWKEVDKNNKDEYMKYAQEDAEDTIELYYRIKDEIKDENLDIVYKLEKEVIFPIIEMEFYGCKLDMDLMKYQNDMLLGYLRDTQEEINSIVGIEYNLNSPKQLQEMFFTVLGYPTNKKWQTKTGYSTAAGVLEHISKDTQRPKARKCAELLLKHRKYAKLLNSFVEKFTAENIGERVYPSFNSTGTQTGRFSCNNPNLQQIPRDPFEYEKNLDGSLKLDAKGKKIGILETHIRSLFIPDDNSFFVGADYSQIELRVMAELSKDPRLLRAYMQGIDVHEQTSIMVGTKDRNIGKTINFMVGYGGGPGTLAALANIPFQLAVRYLQTFWSKYCVLGKFMDTIEADALKLGYVRTISGRKRHLLDANIYDIGYMGRAAKNTVIQGSAADLIKLAMIKIYERKNKEGLRDKVRFVMQVHDELIFNVQNGYEDIAKTIIKEEMEQAVKMSIPIVADPKVGKRWSEVK